MGKKVLIAVTNKQIKSNSSYDKILVVKPSDVINISSIKDPKDLLSSLLKIASVAVKDPNKAYDEIKELGLVNVDKISEMISSVKEYEDVTVCVDRGNDLVLSVLKLAFKSKSVKIKNGC